MQTSFSQAANAYSQSVQNSLRSAMTDDVPDTVSSASGQDFGSFLSNAVSGVADMEHAAETKTAEGLTGGGDMTQIVTAVSNAQLALQASTVIRDKIVSAYQDIMKMSI